MSHRILAGTFLLFLGVSCFRSSWPGAGHSGRGWRAWHFGTSLRPPVRTCSCSKVHQLRHTKVPVLKPTSPLENSRETLTTKCLPRNPICKAVGLLMVSEITSMNSAWMTLFKPSALSPASAHLHPSAPRGTHLCPHFLTVIWKNQWWDKRVLRLFLKLRNKKLLRSKQLIYNYILEPFI